MSEDQRPNTGRGWPYDAQRRRNRWDTLVFWGTVLFVAVFVVGVVILVERS